ncbi:MAG: hypothetical protein K9L26_02930 [Candidatus Izimaplasma sp.]|nr:hypothetical protein [Candidatus Izimaplasma bacterium]
MKKYIVLLLFIITGVVALIDEPIADTIDVFSGATNDTYYVSIDTVAGASEDEHEEDDDE